MPRERNNPPERDQRAGRAAPPAARPARFLAPPYHTLGGRSHQIEFGTWSITGDQDVLDSAKIKIKGYVQVRDAVPVATGLKGVFA